MRPLLKNVKTFKPHRKEGAPVPTETCIDNMWLSPGLEGTCIALPYTEMDTDHAPMLTRIRVTGVVKKIKPTIIRRRKYPKKGTELYKKQACHDHVTR